MEIEFRQAMPEDAPSVVPLIYSSGPAAFDFVFADEKRVSAQGFLDYAFRDGAGEFGCHCHTVVMNDGQVVGAGACYSGETSLSFMLAAIRQIVSFYGPMRGFRVIRRGLQMERLVKPPQRKMNYIGHLGVPVGSRSRGIGRELVEYFFDVGKQAGRSISVLDVSVENPRAQAMYERIGFRTVAECVSELPDVAHHRRMEMPL